MIIRRLHIILALALLLFAYPQEIYAQSKPPLEYQVKAAFLFNFTRFVRWPSLGGGNSPFVIGIAGNDPFGSYIDDLVNGERMGGHPLIVHRYTESDDMSNCNILFINVADIQKLKAILAQVQNLPVLTVSDADGFIKAGGIIRFYKDENHVKMEIKPAAARAAHLEVSAKLLQIARTDN